MYFFPAPIHPPTCPKCKTVSRQSRNAVSHVVDNCLSLPPSRPTVVPYPALAPGTLGMLSNLPTHPKDSISHPNEPQLSGKYPTLYDFLAGGVLPIYIDAGIMLGLI